ncbi:MAG TPA: ATP synthase F1 subunit gamma [Bryobacteraceae bacterium]|jgi:F-type H+-transporting ATPase subunit gamma|nr:ATP synthase F1 subunit gamma [Bryobacteraceae bacterium]
MPSLIDIRRRIRSVKNTQQITKAMKMVSAAKLRRAQERVIAARPYNAMMRRMLSNLAAAVRGLDAVEGHPLLARREEKTIQLVLLTSDRGLAGSFNSNLIKAAQKFIAEHPGRRVLIETLGRKGRDFFRKRASVSGELTGVKAPQYSDAREVANRIIERYERGEIDSVYVICNTFKSVISQELVVNQVLPVELPADAAPVDYIFEEPPEVLLSMLLPQFVEGQLFRAMLESTAAEHAARMTAMDAATTNASDVIDKLTLYMNRVRQASITKEIIEIVSGAAALE